jgi:hypothetical protein
MVIKYEDAQSSSCDDSVYSPVSPAIIIVRMVKKKVNGKGMWIG